MLKKKKKQLTTVNEAMAPLRQIADNLKSVAEFREKEAKDKELRIEVLKSQAEMDKAEAHFAQNNFEKMNELLGGN